MVTWSPCYQIWCMDVTLEVWWPRFELDTWTLLTRASASYLHNPSHSMIMKKERFAFLFQYLALYKIKTACSNYFYRTVLKRRSGSPIYLKQVHKSRSGIQFSFFDTFFQVERRSSDHWGACSFPNPPSSLGGRETPRPPLRASAHGTNGESTSSHNGTEYDVQWHRHVRRVLGSQQRHSPCSKPIQRKPQKRWRSRRPLYISCE